MPKPTFISGNPEPKMAAVTTAQAVEAGDLLGQDSVTANVYRAADQAWDTNLATTQGEFVANFLGVSAQHKDANASRVYGNGVDNRIRVDAAPAVFEFNCGSATFTLGQKVGPAKDTGNALLSDTVVGVGADSLAIGLVAEPVPVAATRVKVMIRSAVLPTSK